MGVFIIPPLPPMLSEECRTARLLRSPAITPLPRYYEPIRHPLVVSRFPGAAGYTAYPASALSGRDEEGFSSCLMGPGVRAVANHPAGATRRVNRFATSRAAFATSQSRSRLSSPPETNHELSGLKTNVRTTSPWRRTAHASPVRASQRRTVPSQLPEAIH